jgi:hypothetical protein
MFMKKKFILGVLYFSAATALGMHLPYDSSIAYLVESAVPEVREGATYDGGEWAVFAEPDRLRFEAAASAGEASFWDNKGATASAVAHLE